MSDPERLLKSSPSELSRLLLRAGADERPSAAALRRTAKAVLTANSDATTSAASGPAGAPRVSARVSAAAGATLAAGTAATTTSAASASTAGLALITKWVAIGALGGALTVGGVEQLAPQEEPSLSARDTASTQGPPAPRARRPVPKTEGALATLPSAAPSAAFELIGPPTLAREPVAVPTQATPPATSAQPGAQKGSALLAEEVLFVDNGRRALQRGAHSEVLARLVGYEELFPNRQLLTEVLFLRMEALARLGEPLRARALAERVLERGVTGAQAKRARELSAQ